MSKISFKPADTGTATFTIEAPATNTNRTLTLPDEAGSVLTNGGALNVDPSAPVESAVIDSSGNVGIGTSSPAVALDVSGQMRASSGVLFGTDTAADNTLDDYEEGTWTPLISVNGGGSDTFTSSTAIGRYTKIGRLVTIECIYTYTAKQSNGDFYAWMTGLPFNPSADSAAFHVSILNPSGADTDSYSAQANNNGSIRFFKNQNISSPGSLVGNDFPAATRSVHFQASYIV